MNQNFDHFESLYCILDCFPNNENLSQPCCRLLMLHQKLHTPPKLIVRVHVQQDAKNQAGLICAKGLVELAVLDAAACRPAPTETTTPALAMLNSLLATTSPNALDHILRINIIDITLCDV